MALRFAFVGFRHYHIFELLEAVKSRRDTELAATCEEDPEARKTVAADKDLKVTHDRFETMLAEVDCDVVAVGDYFGKRGRIIIRALEAGKHVIADKPICTRLDELDRIQHLAAEKGLAVGCQLGMRGDRALRAIRQLVQSGKIGEVRTVNFTGQHPLVYGTRPNWYFEPGRHGGTINDIFIHFASCLEWMTSRRIVEVTAARVWNARLKEVPHFQDGAQMLLRMDNGGGVLGDVSYLAPDRCGYKIPQYWRFLLHGESGMIEGTHGAEYITLATNDSTEPVRVPAGNAEPLAYLEDFLRQVEGRTDGVSLTTAEILKASRLALLVQRAADEKRRDEPCDV